MKQSVSENESKKNDNKQQSESLIFSLNRKGVFFAHGYVVFFFNKTIYFFLLKNKTLHFVKSQIFTSIL